MKNRILIFIAGSVLILSSACKQDDPVKVVHSGTTRIDYSINNPLKMPCIEFTLSNIYDLSDFTNCSISLIANEYSGTLNLMVMLEDEQGNRTDVEPFTVSTAEITKDDQLHTYTYDFSNTLGSSTSFDEGVNIQRINRVLVYINAGIGGSVSEGYFWLDKIEFDRGN